MKLTLAMHTITPAGASSLDADRLVELVAVVELTQRAEDVEGFLALFDPEAVWVTGGGRRLIGLDTIAAFARSVLPGGMAGGSVRYEVDHIRFITPDVALTGVRQEYLTAKGEPLTPRQLGLPTYLWRRGAGGDWSMVAGQNTRVPQEGPFGPEDIAALHAIVRDVQEGFNANDAELMTAHFASDALVVNALGKVHRGRDEIVESSRAGLAAGFLREATAYYRLGDIVPLTDDVVTATKDAWPTEEAARAGGHPEMRALYVFVRREGRWLIARRSNTLVPAAS
ncbi:SgcJ/EcaC family oxidoreductase [Acrocarpospora sp. B8E8]|uniref:SgcJ/EcaC family oxidoreductase n=1 Tax=Acrocarpospora sp. B8E8 TaxID=3153572 RepID=UPI00325FB648